MVMDREASHHQAGSSYGIDCPAIKKPPYYLPANYVSPRTSHIQRNLSELSLADLLQLAKHLKYPSITTLRLSVSPEDQLSGRLHMPLKDGCRLWSWEYAWDYATSTHWALLYVPAEHFDTSHSRTAGLEMSRFKCCLRVSSIASLCRL